MPIGDKSIDLRFDTLACPRCEELMLTKGVEAGSTVIVHKACICGMVLSIVVPPRHTKRMRIALTDIES